MKKRGRIGLLALAVAAISVAGATAAFAGPSSNEKAGFKTARASMLTPVMTGVQVEPLLTVGDVLPSGFRFEAIPGRHLGAHARAGARRRLRESRDVQGAVPLRHCDTRQRRTARTTSTTRR